MDRDAGRAAAGQLPPQESTKLASLLADPATRSAAITANLPRAPELTPHLLRWAKSPPAGVDKNGLYFGLIDFFAEARAREAIPFLVENINFRFPSSVWDKSAEAIIAQSPAIRALVRIGTDATKPLIQAYQRQPLTWQDRVAVVFTVSQLRDPEAKEFLLWVRTPSHLQIRYAEQGLAGLGVRLAPTPSPEFPSPSK